MAGWYGLGPYVHGRSLVLFPDVLSPSHVRNAYIESLEEVEWPVSDSKIQFVDQDDQSEPGIPTCFFTASGGTAIVDPRFGYRTAAQLSAALFTSVLTFVPLGKGAIWTCLLYQNGHLINRHASCPQWIPEGELGDVEFEAFAENRGTGMALREYAKTWRADANVMAETFSVSPSVLAPYLRQFTLAEWDDYHQERKDWHELMASPDDVHCLASQYAFLHLVERLGFQGIVSGYWNPDGQPPSRWSAPPVYSPWRGVSGPYKLAPCTEEPFPFGGFFRSHDEACQEREQGPIPFEF
jgi:hypothetical protein